MKVGVVGLQKNELIKYLQEKYDGFILAEDDPKVILCFGGDGTLLYGEREFPGIPKVLIRNSQICRICAAMTKDTILQLLLASQYEVIDHIKLQATVNKQIIVGLNDIVIGHPKINGTLRAKVLINHQPYKNEFLGDGLVVSTPLGSTAYYQSITNSNFSSGIGLAFNNTITLVNHIVVDEQSVIQVSVTRGPGVVTADNDEREIPLATGDIVSIQKSADTAKIIHFATEHTDLNMTTWTNRIPWGYCQHCRKPYTNS